MLGTPTSNESYKYLQEAARLSICNDNRHVSVYLMTPSLVVLTVPFTLITGSHCVF